MFPQAADSTDMPDRRDGLIYVMPSDLSLAVKVALATGRPLLLRGEPGSGKSSLAPWVARERGWRYYEHVVTSQTRARDLLWTFDAVRRLADAQADRRPGRGRAPQHSEDMYVQPGPLWWAFAPRSAARFVSRSDRSRTGPGHPRPGGPRRTLGADEGRSPDHAVVLIDEIDKADPDVPNGLLVPLASNGFVVAETGTEVWVEPARESSDAPFSRHLIVITTNEERELPQAFLRRCVIARLQPPEDVEELVRIAHRHLTARLPEVTAADLALAAALAEELQEVRQAASRDGVRRPSTAEYLDALWACQSLGITVGDERWQALRGLTLVKPQQLKE
ncbi:MULTISPECIES: MoxR family ATPase [unclassified Streptomyces]|uniref:MoxR family ATPase n=1 Tax=unclassified Streptomyces TaxID=2593676 RepID=UPI002E28AC5A|nr:MoxR family ATPase [Streptomyces sp. NBC_01439]